MYSSAFRNSLILFKAELALPTRWQVPKYGHIGVEAVTRLIFYHKLFVSL
jgi:hypothetical protein